MINFTRLYNCVERAQKGFYFHFGFLYFEGVFDKKIIQLAFVGYEMIIASSCWPSIISYPTRSREIIVNDCPKIKKKL